MLEYAIYLASPSQTIALLKSAGLKLEALKFLEIAAWEDDFEALKSLIRQTRGLDVGIFTKNNLAFEFILKMEKEELLTSMSRVRQLYLEMEEIPNISQYIDRKILEAYRFLLRYGCDPYLCNCIGSCTASVKRYFEHCMILLTLSSARTIERIGFKTKVAILPTELLHQLSGMLF
jgi:hypothetical protein